MKGNNKMKKKIVKVLCVVMAAMCVTGCGSKDEKNAGGSSSANSIAGVSNEEMFSWEINDDTKIWHLAPEYEDTQVLIIPKRCENIGQAAFYENTSITEVSFENDNTQLEKMVFCDCTNLKKVQLPNNLNDIKDSLFSRCALEEIEIPDSVTEIGANAFANCESLKKVKFGAGIKSIGKDAFRSCDNLEEIDLPEGVESIGDGAFKYCDNVKTITLPESLKEIGQFAFLTGNSVDNSTITLRVKKGSYADESFDVGFTKEYY